MNKIEQYYLDENGTPKVIMSQSTAIQLQSIISGFEIGKSIDEVEASMCDLGSYIAENFLADENAKEKLHCWHEYRAFITAIRSRINEFVK
ncbi:MAG: hypothetical protein HFJ58_04115 [Clostridia bacterium]|nr:hypothetical protein [Clostridia bacterium]